MNMTNKNEITLFDYLKDLSNGWFKRTDGITVEDDTLFYLNNDWNDPILGWKIYKNGEFVYQIAKWEEYRPKDSVEFVARLLNFGLDWKFPPDEMPKFGAEVIVVWYSGCKQLMVYDMGRWFDSVNYYYWNEDRESSPIPVSSAYNPDKWMYIND
jgi:hypothetical protein